MPFWKKYKSTLRSRRIEKNAQRSGLRKTLFNTQGDKYFGEWKNDQKSGKGVLITPHKGQYEGDFERNYRHGFGVYTLPVKSKRTGRYMNVQEFRGDWVNGRMFENGMWHSDEAYYVGKFRSGKRNGIGQMWWYPDGGYYIGDWSNGMRHGLGMHIEDNGNRYEGAWERDLKHGYGRFYHLDNGQMHEGVWVEGVFKVGALEDIPYRNAAVEPTQFPLPPCGLIEIDKLIEVHQEKRLAQENPSCLITVNHIA